MAVGACVVPQPLPPFPAPPGEEGGEELRQRVEELAENMRRMRAAIRSYEMLAKQLKPGREGEGLDQAAPDQTPADQAGLIAEGDVPSPECSCCGLPIAESRPCPH